MTAYNVLAAGLALALHEPGLFARNTHDQSESGSEWSLRRPVTVTIAIVLWLLIWFGGWWVGRALSSGSFVMTMGCACLGWCVGLGIATLFFYLDERL